jgi:hypothetical protein
MIMHDARCKVDHASSNSSRVRIACEIPAGKAMLAGMSTATVGPGGPRAQRIGCSAAYKLTMKLTMAQKNSVMMLARHGDLFCCTAPASREHHSL